MIADTKARNQAELQDTYDRLQSELSELKSTDADKAKEIQAYQDKLTSYFKARMQQINSDNAWSKMENSWGNAMENMTNASAKWADSFANQLAEGKVNFKTLATSIINDISEIITKAILAQYVLNPILQGLGLNTGTQNGGLGLSSGGGFSGGGLVGSLGNMMQNALGIIGNVTMPSIGAGFMSGSADLAASSLADTSTLSTGADVLSSIFHTGGIVGTDFAGAKSVNPSIFSGAMKYHTGGIAGLQPNEVPAILQDGEGVFTKEQMKSIGKYSGGTSISGAPNVHINLNNQSGVPLDGDSGGMKFDGEKYILDVVVSHLGRPGALRSAIRSSQ